MRSDAVPVSSAFASGWPQWYATTAFNIMCSLIALCMNIGGLAGRGGGGYDRCCSHPVASFDMQVLGPEDVRGWRTMKLCHLGDPEGILASWLTADRRPSRNSYRSINHSLILFYSIVNGNTKYDSVSESGVPFYSITGRSKNSIEIFGECPWSAFFGKSGPENGT